MPYPETSFRSELDPTTRKELDEYSAVLTGLLSSQHGPNGTHLDVTAISVESLYGYRITGQAANVGEWVTPGFKTTYFTANGAMTWTVQRADVNIFKYTIIGATMILQFKLSSTTVAGVPNTTLKILIPGNYRAVSDALAYIRATDNGSSTDAIAEALEGATVVNLYLPSGFPSALGAWAASANNTGVYGAITFEVARV